MGRRVLSVEYPVGPGAPDRQNLLQPGELNDPGFFAQDGFYAVEYTPDSAGEIVLWLSGAPDGADCRLTCHCDHPSLDDDSDVTSLPERHLELVMLYVRWASYQELASAESSNPDPTSLALSTLELNDVPRPAPVPDQLERMQTGREREPHDPLEAGPLGSGVLITAASHQQSVFSEC